ncbi:putative small nuclear ribonucleoprotein F [Pseudocercospora fuligena]|uniref:Sm protein F n=1 Tax=Pseudocercospora fuligena TaxID=685502 RepID=A0A8H6VJN6_9PEZI|nr:putative small nuclear ribonucleoprotein F [Pseudocercospora fuligena]
MSFVPLNPRPMLQGLVNKEVVVKIKWGQEYTGRLVSVDSYMNIQLSGAQEWKDGVDNGVLGQVLIRCNNVLWISARKGKQENGDADMDG